MRPSGKLILLLTLCFLGGCATQPPRYRYEAAASLERAKRAGAVGPFATELYSARVAYDKGELLLGQREKKEAEGYFFLALQKGALLEQEIRAEQARLKEAARLLELEKKAELERRAQEEAQRLAQAKAAAIALKAQADAELQARKEALETERRRVKQREHPLVYSYTVRRGESLPLIASQTEVYGDRNLWPLLYRANRDQISDPHHIWPGQVLRIPRNLGRDDFAEARRYSQERPLH